MMRSDPGSQMNIAICGEQANLFYSPHHGHAAVKHGLLIREVEGDEALDDSLLQKLSAPAVSFINDHYPAGPTAQSNMEDQGR